MLVLTRSESESIRIGDGPDAVTVTLVRLFGKRARIGIEAPRHVPVVRSEIADRDQEETPDARP